MGLQTGIFSDLLEEQRKEYRTSLENPQSPLTYPAEWLIDIFNGGRTDSGIRVSELTAFQATTFLSCVDLISGSIASLPLHVYERTLTDKGRAAQRIAYDHDLYDILHTEPNDEMSSFVFLKAFLVHALAWPGAYAEIQRDQGNGVVALWPRNPAKTGPFRTINRITLEPKPWRPFPVTIEAGELCYRTADAIDEQDRTDQGADPQRGQRLIPASDMLSVPGLSFDGRVGQGIVWLARQALGLALATEKFGAKYFANYAKPGGILELPVNMSTEAKEQARRSWMEAQGGENAHRVAVLPPGMKWTAMSNNPQEAQGVETRQFIRNEICSIFHVPPHMVGEIDKGRANVEQMAQEFASYTLQPWIMALKQEFKRKLLPSRGRGRTPRNNFYIDFDLWGMLRPDAAGRDAFYRGGRQWGYLNANDCREKEGMNPIEGDAGEMYLVPINMTDAENPVSAADQAEPTDAKTEEPPAKKPPQRSNPYSRLFRDAFGRVLAREKRDSALITRAFGPVLYSLVDDFSQEANGTTSVETEKFVADYLGGMLKRCTEWTNDDEVAAQELERATKAIKLCVFRDIAAQKAKEN